MDITVDNGNTSTANQTYLNTEILGLTVRSGASFVTFTSPPDTLNTVEIGGYVTTDAAGMATLSLLDTPVGTLAQYFRGPIEPNDVEAIQLGTKVTGQGGFSSYSAEFADGGLGVINDGFTVTSRPNIIYSNLGPGDSWSNTNGWSGPTLCTTIDCPTSPGAVRDSMRRS